MPNLESFEITCCECAGRVGSSGPSRATLLLPCQHVLHLRCVEYLHRQHQLRQELATHGVSLRGTFYSQKDYRTSMFICPGCSVNVEKVVPLYVGETAHAPVSEQIDYAEKVSEDNEVLMVKPITKNDVKGEKMNIIDEMEIVFRSQQRNLASLRRLIKEKLLVHELTRSCATLYNEQISFQADLEKSIRVIPQLKSHLPFSSCGLSCSTKSSCSSSPSLENYGMEELQMYLAHTSPVLQETEKELRKIRKKNDHKRKQIQKLEMHCRKFLKQKESVRHSSLGHPNGALFESEEKEPTVKKQQCVLQENSPNDVVSPLADSLDGSSADDSNYLIRALPSLRDGQNEGDGEGSSRDTQICSSSSTPEEAWNGHDLNSGSDSMPIRAFLNEKNDCCSRCIIPERTENMTKNEIVIESEEEEHATNSTCRKRRRTVNDVDAHILHSNDVSSGKTVVSPSFVSPNNSMIVEMDDHHHLIRDIKKRNDKKEVKSGERETHQHHFHLENEASAFPLQVKKNETGRKWCRAAVIVDVDNEEGGDESNIDEIYEISDSDNRLEDENYHCCQQSCSSVRSGRSDLHRFSPSESCLSSFSLCEPPICTTPHHSFSSERNPVDCEMQEEGEKDDENGDEDNLFLDSLTASTLPRRPSSWVTEKVPNNALQLLPRAEDYLWQRTLP